MRNYLRAVTLGAFTWRNGERIDLFFEQIRKTGAGWLLLHFLLLTFCLNFPMTLIMARLEPYELYNRLYGENFLSALPESARVFFSENPVQNQDFIAEFNAIMLQNGYGKNVLLPLLGITFVLTLIIQTAYYLCSVFFLKLSRLNAAPLSFRSRFGLAVFSSTLPALAAALFGLFLPTVHLLVFYFAVIFIIFQRSNIWNSNLKSN